MTSKQYAGLKEKRHTDDNAANGTGSGDWAEAYVKARALVAKMTLEEKVRMTRGFSSVLDARC